MDQRLVNLEARIAILGGRISKVDYQIKQMMDVMSGTIKALRKVESILKEKNQNARIRRTLSPQEPRT